MHTLRNQFLRGSPIGSGVTGRSFFFVTFCSILLVGAIPEPATAQTCGWATGFEVPGNGMLAGNPFAFEVFDDGSGPALIAGGNGMNLGGTAYYIAKLDSSGWSPLGSGVNHIVWALKTFDDGSGSGTALYAAGDFSVAGGAPDTRSIARWDGAVWSALGTGLFGARALEVFDDNSGNGEALYVGGWFTHISGGGALVNRIAKWDGASGTWSALGGGLDGHVAALAVYDDGSGGGEALYASGGFDATADGSVQLPKGIAKWDGGTWSPVGSPPVAFPSSPDVLAVYDGALYAGRGNTTLSLHKWDGTSWSVVESVPGAGGVGLVGALTVFDDGNGDALYAGGWPVSADGVPASGIARWDGNAWSTLGSGLDHSVYALGPPGGFDDGTGPALYAGGLFSTAGGIESQGIAAWRCGPLFNPGPGLTMNDYMREVPGGGAGPDYTFRMGKFEITVAQFIAFLNDAEANPANPRGSNMVFDVTGDVSISNGAVDSIFDLSDNAFNFPPVVFDNGINYVPADLVGSRYTFDPSRADYPIVGVSYLGALKFCNWLTIVQGLDESQRCYTEGPDVLDWHPVTISTLDWTDRDLNPAERQALVDNYFGFRLPMDDVGLLAVPVGDHHLSNQESAFNERYKAAAFDPTGVAPGGVDPILGGTNISPDHWLYGFGRDVLSDADANYRNSGDPFDDGPTPVGSYDGSSINGIFATNVNDNFYNIFDMSGNVLEWGQDYMAVDPIDPLLSRHSVRGGSFFSRIDIINNQLLSSHIAGVFPEGTEITRGFRVVQVTCIADDDCDDGDACTDDYCVAGIGCVNDQINCNSGNPCTIDICDVATGCVSTPVDCNDGDACTDDYCVPGTGCVNDQIVCDDLDACTIDICDVATGCEHDPVNCNGGNDCNDDVCDPVLGCVQTPRPAGTLCGAGSTACSDEVCDGAGNCVQAAAPSGTLCPDDGDPCTDDECDGAGNCIHPWICGGACCLPSGSCSISTQAGCTADYQGNGTTCTPNNCAGECPPFVPGIQSNTYTVMGSGNNTPWSWSLSGPGWQITELNTNGGSNGNAAALAALFAERITDAGCPQITAAAVTGTDSFEVTVIDGELTELCVGVAGQQPGCCVTDGNVCSFNPYIVLESECPADLDGDGVVGAADLAITLGSWGPCPACPADLNGDEVVGAADLAIVLGSWGECVDPPPDSDCCEDNGTPGCDDPDCEATVCEVDPVCCDGSWDALCANEAAELCAVCGAGP